MFKTLKSNNGAFAGLGNPQVQSPTDSPGYVVNAQTNDRGSSDSYQSVLAQDASTNTHVITENSGSIGVMANPSIATIARAVGGGTQVNLPSLAASRFNRIDATFRQSLTGQQISRPSAAAIATVTRKYEPYEQLTGVAHDRPEIIMMMDFAPLFDSDGVTTGNEKTGALDAAGVSPSMTDVGKFVDAQFQLRRLRVDNVRYSFDSLSRRYASMRGLIYDHGSAMTEAMARLQDSSDFLLNVVRSIEELRYALDLQSDFHIIEPASVVQAALASNMSRDLFSGPRITDASSRLVPTKYTVVDALQRYGYTKAGAEAFVSTKLWLQMLYELKQALKFHTLDLIDIDPAAQRSDVDPVALTKPKIAYFGLRPEAFGVPTVDVLKGTSIESAPATVRLLQTAYANFYNGIRFNTDEARIAALCHITSQEFRYSTSLSDVPTQNVLSSVYGFKTADVGNRDIFDYVFGEFGVDATDATQASPTTLAGLGQRIITAADGNDIVVLPFETKYIESDRGTLTPGASYYVEELLRTNGKTFNTDKMAQFAKVLDDQTVGLRSAIAALQLGSFPQSGDADNAQSLATVYGSAPDLARRLTSLVVDQKGNLTDVVATDPATAAFFRATKDPQLKAMLFLAVLMKMTRAYTPGVEFPADPGADNTPVNDYLIDKIEASIYGTTPTVDPDKINTNLRAAGKKSLNVDRGVLKDAIRSGMLVTKVGDFLTQTLDAMGSFKVTNSGQTRFSGYSDAAIMMLVFDAICSSIARFSEQEIVGVYSSRSQNNLGVEYFVVSATSKNWSTSLDDIRTRLERQAASVQQLVYATLSVMTKLSGTFKGHVNYFTSPTSTAHLQHIVNVLVDPDLVAYFFSEQQIMLFVAAVTDLVEKARGSSAIQSVVSDDSDSDDASAIKVLDDSVVSPKTRDALYRVMSSDEFTTKKGFNKRVMTVGVPVGFSHRLLQTSSAKGRYPRLAGKQADIVRVNVYKVDMEHSDLVFKPQKFLFELSRFPVRNDAHYLNISKTSSNLEAIASIPMRDFSAESSGDVEYIVSRPGSPTDGKRIAFSDGSYSFLSFEEKLELARNHVMSYLLETYVKLLTGLSMADYHFDAVSVPKQTSSATFVKQLVDGKMSHLSQKPVSEQLSGASEGPRVGGSVFSNSQPRGSSQKSGTGRSSQPKRKSNSSGTGGSIDQASQFNDPQTDSGGSDDQIDPLSKSLSSIKKHRIPLAMHEMKTINSFSNMVTSHSDGAAVSRRLMSPKQFDRVFNIVVDPDDFEIDVKATQASEHGKTLLRQMVEQGKVIAQPGQLQLRQGAQPEQTYRFVERDKGEGDLSFDKYFVAVETYDEEAS